MSQEVIDFLSGDLPDVNLLGRYVVVKQRNSELKSSLNLNCLLFFNEVRFIEQGRSLSIDLLFLSFKLVYIMIEYCCHLSNQIVLLGKKKGISLQVFLMAAVSLLHLDLSLMAMCILSIGFQNQGL